MSDSLFREGGPYKARRIDSDRYEMHIQIPLDTDGMVGRECPDPLCSPGYFKIKPGTGIVDGQTIAYCPYCRKEEDPNGFLTQAQKDYAIKLVRNEAINGINRAIAKGLGVGPSGKRKLGSGMFSMELSFNPSRLPPVSRPIEEELRRDVICPHCHLAHAVFGLATWCPDCGQDIFMSHVGAELEVVKKILGAVEARRSELGARVAFRDIENSLEDVVSIFEAVLKIITKRHFVKSGFTSDEIEGCFNKKIRNSYQSVKKAESTFNSQVGLPLYEDIDDKDVSDLNRIFEKRHPITHNLGVVDRKYLDTALSDEREGREVRVTADEVLKAIEISLKVLQSAYERI